MKRRTGSVKSKRAEEVPPSTRTKSLKSQRSRSKSKRGVSNQPVKLVRDFPTNSSVPPAPPSLAVDEPKPEPEPAPKIKQPKPKTPATIVDAKSLRSRSLKNKKRIAAAEARAKSEPPPKELMKKMSGVPDAPIQKSKIPQPVKIQTRPRLAAPVQKTAKLPKSPPPAPEIDVILAPKFSKKSKRSSKSKKSKQLAKPGEEQPDLYPDKISPLRPKISEKSAVSARTLSEPIIIGPRRSKSLQAVKHSRPERVGVPSHFVAPITPTPPQNVFQRPSTPVHKEPKIEIPKKKKSEKSRKQLTATEKSEVDTLAQYKRDILDERDIVKTVQKEYAKLVRKERWEMHNLPRLLGMPRQKELVKNLLQKDFVDYDFKGYMRLHYSPMFRHYMLGNWANRYRSTELHSKWMMALNMTPIGTKPEELAATLKVKFDAKTQHLEPLRSVSIDDEHYEFLVELATNQPITIPITVMHTMLKEIKPLLEELYQYYFKVAGSEHMVTKNAAQSYNRVVNRLNMYQNM